MSQPSTAISTGTTTTPSTPTIPNYLMAPPPSSPVPPSSLRAPQETSQQPTMSHENAEQTAASLSTAPAPSAQMVVEQLSTPKRTRGTTPCPPSQALATSKPPSKPPGSPTMCAMSLTTVAPPYTQTVKKQPSTALVKQAEPAYTPS
jgi:hypothetical protein